MKSNPCLIVPLLALIAVAEADKSGLVGCGSAIKLTHVDSGGSYQLTSNGHNWGGGSGQQVVTLMDDRTAQSALWLVREAHDTPQCIAGTPIECGSTIRLTHLLTLKNLHTHFVRSALSGQQEVSGYGNKGEGDDSDNWILVCSGKYWEQGQKIRLKHEATGKYLSSAKQNEFNNQNCRNCPILNHLEAAATARVDGTSYFTTDVGIYLSH